MSTPVIYLDGAIDPFAHLQDSARQPPIDVFFATNRAPEGEDRYGNEVANSLYVGQAVVRLGSDQDSWDELYLASRTDRRASDIPLQLKEVVTQGEMALDAPPPAPLPPALQAYADAINLELEKAQDKEIIVYVHGTKVDFANACELIAEVDHFAGRDFVGLAFSWPSHQNIASYLLGIDVDRARQSSTALARLIQFLGIHTAAERINLIGYSAGGRVLSKALYELQQDYPGLDHAQLQTRFRIGATVFAAADVPEETFEERLPSVSLMAEQVLITTSDNDDALRYAHWLMPGGVRVGTDSASQPLYNFTHSHHLNNVNVLDLSYDHQRRGFDISGHHYWYRHAWASSDVILLMRTDMPPARRGLSATSHPAVWYMSSDYPSSVRDATHRELDGQW
ncbi:conserved protein of unknown function [Pseudomonas marincola]|uniref:Alpha/beta hydrolase n=1 Tax=Pseudomonas marincola TaxID=437900 RepID=A0A653E2R9_9PSED|nr:alpha/beta hydrolase [Pseudomonas marincola]CAE6881985.1 conserved protein of unknown function [Pseudomonas marincola]